MASGCDCCRGPHQRRRACPVTPPTRQTNRFALAGMQPKLPQAETRLRALKLTCSTEARVIRGGLSDAAVEHAQLPDSCAAISSPRPHKKVCSDGTSAQCNHLCEGDCNVML